MESTQSKSYLFQYHIGNFAVADVNFKVKNTSMNEQSKKTFFNKVGPANEVDIICYLIPQLIR